MANNRFQKGAVSIAIAILILSLISVIGFATAFLILQQLKMSGQASRSVVAFYAADAGAERCLYRVRYEEGVDCPFTDEQLDFDSSALYTTTYNGSDQIISVGHFGDASRKIEISW